MAGRSGLETSSTTNADAAVVTKTRVISSTQSQTVAGTDAKLAPSDHGQRQLEQVAITTGSNTQATVTGAAFMVVGFRAGSIQQLQNNGTRLNPFQPYREREGETRLCIFLSITMQLPYWMSSFEELRLADYQQHWRYGSTKGQAGAPEKPKVPAIFSPTFTSSTQAYSRRSW